MAIFGIEAEEEPILTEFLKETDARLNMNDMLKNPFNGRIKSYGSLHIVAMQPLYFNFSIFGWLGALGVLVLFQRLTYWLIPPLCLASIGIFWSKYFYYLMFRIGLKKKGYKGKIKLLNNTETLKRLIEWDRQKS